MWIILMGNRIVITGVSMFTTFPRGSHIKMKMLPQWITRITSMIWRNFRISLPSQFLFLLFFCRRQTFLWDDSLFFYVDVIWGNVNKKKWSFWSSNIILWNLIGAQFFEGFFLCVDFSKENMFTKSCFWEKIFLSWIMVEKAKTGFF
jgi:hypothetical protein